MHVLKILSATILTQVSTSLLYLKDITKFSIAYKMLFRHFKKQICNGFTKRYSMPKCNHDFM
jgi:hypothetical protein